LAYNARIRVFGGVILIEMRGKIIKGTPFSFGGLSEFPGIKQKLLIYYTKSQAINQSRPRADYFFERGDLMNVREIARDHGCTPNRVYQVMYELEAKRKIVPERKRNLRLELSLEDLETLKTELERRGYRES